MANIKILRKMICVLQPFALSQLVFVYENGNKIDAAEVEVDNLVNQILSFCDKYYLSKVSFTGPIQYARGIGKKVQEKFITEYGREVEIEYLNN